MFLTDLHSKYITNGYSKITKVLKFASNIVGMIVVNPGFLTDFASIPRLVRWLITGNDNTKPGAVIHDYLYKSQTKGITRKQADGVFLEAMLHPGKQEWVVPKWKAYTVYYGVRVGAWITWRKYGNSKRN